MDRIIMERMMFYGYHGVFVEEQRLGQRYIVDVQLHFNLQPAGREDDLESTVNYAEAYERIREVVEGPPFKLIETLAENIATMLLSTYTIVSETTVRVTKPHPPVGMFFDGVTVEIHRKRMAQ